MLQDLKFDNRFIRELPGDPKKDNERRQVLQACYSLVMPKSTAAPQLVAYSKALASELDLNDTDCESNEFLKVFSGNHLLKGMEPFSYCYGGHQFGNWAGQLGDGRAINLGEVINKKNERLILQLKGAGPTPYSRTADGFAVLRSSVREFLCSEAMYHLGVPTTRALSLMLTGEQVIRDMFYDGHPKSEPGAVVCRVAPSFIRFGSFEIFAARNEIKVLRKLVDYTIRTDFPHLGAPTQSVYVEWFKEICQRTADLLVQWMRVGFVHGVMNTDNMSILGLTIDYGPYGWLEDCDPDWTPNTTDSDSRRYRFGQQPHIALWNLHKLANAIHPLIEHTEFLEEALSAYSERYNAKWQSMMAHKLGFKEFGSVDDALVEELLAILPLAEIDMTIFYRKLATIDINLKEPEKLSNEMLIVPFLEAYYKLEQLTDEYLERMGDWVRFYIMRLKKDNLSNEERRNKMNAVNPKYVLRNYLAQLAIDKAEQGDFSMVNELLDVLHYPYDEQPDKAIYSEKRPDWARSRAGCSMLSCSS